MTNMKKLFSQFKYYYLLIFALTLLGFIGQVSSFSSYNSSNTTTIAFYFIGLYFIFTLAFSSFLCIHQKLRLDILFDKSRIDSFKEMTHYLVFLSISFSIVYISISILISNISSVLPNTIGLNWNTFDNTLEKLIILSIIMYFVASTSLCSVLAFFRNKLIYSITTILTIFIVFTLSKVYILNFILWGENKIATISLIIVIAALSNVLSLKLISRYELSY